MILGMMVKEGMMMMITESDDGDGSCRDDGADGNVDAADGDNGGFFFFPRNVRIIHRPS